MHVMELGCATGGNSVHLLREVISSTSRHVAVAQVDLPSNAWQCVFDRAREWATPATSHCVVGRSFYEKHLCPPGSVDLCFSFTSLHWVRSEQTWPAGPEQVRSQVAEWQAGEGSASFRVLVENTLTALKRGGVAVWAFPACDEEEVELFGSAFAYREAVTGIFGSTQETNIPALYRTPATVRSVLQEFREAKVLSLELQQLQIVAEGADVAAECRKVWKLDLRSSN